MIIKKKPEKIRSWTGFELVINWAHSQCVASKPSWQIEHRFGIAEVKGSNPVEALIFSSLLLSNCLNWKINCNDHSSLSSTTAVQIWIMSYILHIISLPTGDTELNQLTSLPMCDFIVQLVEHRTGIAEVTDSNPVEALIFFRLLLSNCLNWKIYYCDDHSSLSSWLLVV